MSDKISPPDKIKPQIDKIKTRLVWAKNNNNNLSYKIEYCSSNDDEWHFAQKGTDPNLFIKTCKETISKMGADAIKVSTYLNNKFSESEIIRVTDTIIPFLDDPENGEDKNSKPNNDINVIADAIRHSGLGRISERQGGNETQIEILKVKHENAIQRFQDKIEALNEKITEKDNEIKNLNKDLDLYENDIRNLQEQVSIKKINSGKRQDFLLAAGLGKMLNMKNNEIIGLAGILTGNDMQIKSDTGKEELLDPDKEGQQEGNEGKRKEDIKIITDWLHEIDDNSFQYICFIIRTLAAKPELYLETMNFIDKKTKEKKEELKEEKKETTATEENKENTNEPQNTESNENN
ncbi:MAG: hypothetical protein WC223_12500 [Bacteroidales bacterium]|jgi:hypothetical protein